MKNSQLTQIFLSLFVALAVTPCLQGQDLQNVGDSTAEARGTQMLEWYTAMQETGSNSGHEEQFFTIELLNATAAAVPGGYSGTGTLLTLAELVISPTSQNGYHSLGSTFEMSSVDDLR